jgi:hypothetical protein
MTPNPEPDWPASPKPPARLIRLRAELRALLTGYTSSPSPKVPSRAKQPSWQVTDHDADSYGDSYAVDPRVSVRSHPTR